MRKSLVLFMAIIIMTLSVSCGTESGTIYDKEFIPTHYQIVPITTKVGKIPVIKYITIWIEDKYFLYIKNGEETGSIQVNKEEYEKYQIGDFYNGDE